VRVAVSGGAELPGLLAGRRANYQTSQLIHSAINKFALLINSLANLAPFLCVNAHGPNQQINDFTEKTRRSFTPIVKIKRLGQHNFFGEFMFE